MDETTPMEEGSNVVPAPARTVVPLDANGAPQVLNARQYLDTYVVPSLLQALGAVVKERPENAVEFVANFLLNNQVKIQAKTNQSNENPPMEGEDEFSNAQEQ